MKSSRIYWNVLLLVVMMLSLLLLNQPVQGQDKEEDERVTYILFVVDGSVSMHTRWETTTRMNVAKQTLKEILENLKDRENIRLGLRVYGHTSPENIQDCKDTRLEVPFSSQNHDEIKEELGTLTPRGTTPLTYALEKAADDFPSQVNSRNIIILITDGREACGGDPCQVSTKLQRKNVILKPFVIGMQLPKSATNELDCIGTFHNAQGQKDFDRKVKEAVKRSLGTATSQFSLLDQQGNPSERDVNLTVYDNFTKKAEFNYYQTFNTHGHPDTFHLDPVKTYDVTAHTIPSKHKEKINIEPKQHNIIPFKTPQGVLEVQLKGQTIENNIHGKIRCIVYKQGAKKIINVQEINKSTRYLVGKYDLEILTLPRIKMDGIQVSQSNTTNITVPSPGLVSIVCEFPGYGGVFIRDKETNQLRKIYRINTETGRQILALQPREYTIIFRPKLAHNAEETIVKKFEVKSGGSITIKLD